MKSPKWIFVLLFLFCPFVLADERPQLPTNRIIFPESKGKKEVLKMVEVVSTETPVKLIKHSICVVRCDTEIAITTRPAGLIEVITVKSDKVDPDKVIKYGGLFVDGTGDIEEKVFTEKYIYRIKPLQSGLADVIMFRLDTKSFEIRQIQVELEPPKPTPIIPTPDKPKPEPIKPNDQVNLELLGKLKTALAKDEKEFPDWKNAKYASAKDAYKALGESYATIVEQLRAASDPASKPATWKDAIEALNEISGLKEIPKLPALQQVRNDISDFIGGYDSKTKFTSIEGEVVEKFSKVAATLKEVSK